MTAKYPKHDKALASAIKDVGVHEEPWGSNTGPRVQVYQHATWLGGTGWPWCCAFCVYHSTRAGFKLPYLGAGAYAWLDWARGAGWSVQSKDAIPGDYVVWNIGAGHMSMLREPIKGGVVKTVDGNVSDRVDIRERPLSLARGFVHLPELAAKPPPARVPVFEVVTAEDGHKVIYVSGARAVGRKLQRILGNHPLGVTIRPKKKRP